MTSAERSDKHLKDPWNRDADNTYWARTEGSRTPSYRWADRSQEGDWLYPEARTRTNQSQQKIGKIKDRNRKRVALECDNGGKTSTNRVCKYPDKIKLTFTSKKAKFDRVLQSISRPLELLSPKSKVDARAQTCASSMSPESRDDLANRIHENSLIDFTKSIGKKLDKASNYARCLALSHLVTKAGGMYNKGRKLDRWLKFKS